MFCSWLLVGTLDSKFILMNGWSFENGSVDRLHYLGQNLTCPHILAHARSICKNGNAISVQRFFWSNPAYHENLRRSKLFRISSNFQSPGTKEFGLFMLYLQLLQIL